MKLTLKISMCKTNNVRKIKVLFQNVFLQISMSVLKQPVSAVRESSASIHGADLTVSVWKAWSWTTKENVWVRRISLLTEE